MSQCSGVMGFIFGHKYIPVIVKSASRHGSFEVKSMSEKGLCNLLDKFRHETYGGLYCSRCGETKSKEGD
ncbi:Uncharacterised protein [Yersinia intermedia]|nr:Uncharacterised protein [Yersinia intermedia]